MEELQTSAEPLTDYLSHGGCLRPLTSLMDKNPLLEDALMFQVIHRVRGPFERYIMSPCILKLGLHVFLQAHYFSYSFRSTSVIAIRV